MSWRRVFIAAAVAFSLGAFWWSWGVQGAPRRAQAKSDANLALPGLKGIGALELQARDGAEAPLILRFLDARWKILSPKPMDADSVQAEALGEQLRTLKKIEVVAGKDADLKEYGLDQPNTLFAFTPVSGPTRVLLLGALNPTGQYVYAREKDGVEVFMIDKGLRQAMLRGPDAYRDKSFLIFVDADVERVASTFGAGWTMRRQGVAWTLGSKAEQAADAQRVQGYFAQLRRLGLEKVVDEAPKNTAKWGITAASKRVELYLKGQAKPLTLRRGAKAAAADGDGYYYQASSRPFVFTLGAWTNNIIETNPSQLLPLPTPAPTTEKP